MTAIICKSPKYNLIQSKDETVYVQSGSMYFLLEIYSFSEFEDHIMLWKRVTFVIVPFPFHQTALSKHLGKENANVHVI